MVDVTQADRTVADLMLIASRDYYRRCEIAARHREAALTAAQAEADALRAERDKLAGIVQGWHYLAVGPDEMGDYYTHKQLVKLSEPYASPALKALSERQP